MVLHWGEWGLEAGGAQVEAELASAGGSGHTRLSRRTSIVRSSKGPLVLAEHAS